MNAKGWAIIIIILLILIKDPQIFTQIVDALINLINSKPQAG